MLYVKIFTCEKDRRLCARLGKFQDNIVFFSGSHQHKTNRFRLSFDICEATKHEGIGEMIDLLKNIFWFFAIMILSVS